MKKGFLVYFDNCRQTAALSDDQYAAVWRALFGYAERLARGQKAEAYLEERAAGLPDTAGMALRFIADNVRRDHLRYQARTEVLQAAQKRGAARKELPAGAAQPPIDPDVMKYI